MDLVDAEDLRELSSGHIDIAGEGRDGMSIGYREPFGDTGSTGRMITKGLDDEIIGNIGVSSALIYETEMVRLDIFAIRVGTLPASLMDLQDQPESILQDGMIDMSFVDPLGVHSAATGRAEMS